MLALVGGCPRGATTYAARVLSACGLPARREAMLRGASPRTLHASDALVESSWLAVPWFPAFNGLRILVVRPPVDVIASMWRSGDILGARTGKTTLQSPYVANVLPRVMRETGLRRLAAFWAAWMRWGEAHADVVWPVPITPAMVADVGRRLDVAVEPEAATGVPADVNAGTGGHEVPWGDLDDDVMADLAAVAWRLGVSLSGRAVRESPTTGAWTA